MPFKVCSMCTFTTRRLRVSTIWRMYYLVPRKHIMETQEVINFERKVTLDPGQTITYTHEQDAQALL